MKLSDIVLNSNYITDEEMQDTNILGISNQAIAEINSKCNTELPFFVEENLSTTNYSAIKSASWLLRLIEPYLSYSIAANDTDTNNRDFHYNRFLQSVQEFKNDGLDYILTEDPITHEPTGYEGKSARMVKIDASEVNFHWLGFN